MVADERERLVAGNEALHRQVNEAIERGRWPGEEEERAFRCECARRGCAEMISITAEVYESVRAHPRRFVLKPGHEDLDVEDVVVAAPGWIVVQKHGEAGQVGEAT